MAIGHKKVATKKSRPDRRNESVVISNSQQINYMYNLEDRNTSSFIRLAKRILRDSTSGQFIGILPKAAAKKSHSSGSKKFASAAKKSFATGVSSFPKAAAKKKVGSVKKASVKKASAKKVAKAKPKKAARKA